MSIIIDDLLRISTKKLRQWNYFNHEGIKSGVISWSRGEQTTASISISVNMIEDFIKLSYNYNNQPIDTKINLEYLDSNLGAGKIIYFICPNSWTRCSKLYLVNGHFLCRKAIRNALYDNQRKCKAWRGLDQLITLDNKRQKLLDDLDVPYRKSHYRGEWTKKSKQLIMLSKKIERLQPIALSMFQ